DLIAKLEVAARCRIRLLGGSEEARLVHDGVRWALPLGPEPTLVCDLGGGSLELAVGVNGNVRWDASFPLGASRLSARIVRHDPVTEHECERAVEVVRSELSGARTTLARDFPYLR